MIKILHIGRDEKFIDQGLRQFEGVPGLVNYLIVIADKKVKYVKSTANILRQEEVKSFFQGSNILDFDLIVFHSIDSLERKLLKYIPGQIRILWIGWGYDYMNLIDFSKQSFYSEKTKVLLRKKEVPSLYKLKEIIKKCSLLSRIQSWKFKNDINNVDFFAPVIYEEYLMIKNKWKSFKPTYVSWNYGTVSHLVANLDNHVNGNNIILGNSASPFNNHLDILDKLADLDFKNSEIICPLSYGDGWYSQQVIVRGKHLFENFRPLVDFVILEDYYSILKTCSIGIFGHYRQQAAGNITLLLAMGTKIFLYERNPLFRYYTSKGYIIFKIEDLNQKSLEGLTEEEIEQNKRVSLKRFKDPDYLNRTELLIKQIFPHK